MLWPPGEGVFVHLRLDVQLLDALGVVQAVHLDFVVEVADVADDGLVFHLRPCVPSVMMSQLPVVVT